MIIPSEPLGTVRNPIDASFWDDDTRKVVVAHITGWHPLPRDHAHECGLCENEVLKQQLKYAEQKLDHIGRYVADYKRPGMPEQVHWLTDWVTDILGRAGCCCCPVGCKWCILDDCECHEHAPDHDTRCLGSLPVAEAKEARRDA